MATLPEPLPLRYSTPEEWVEAAMQDPLALLDDHAHLERKAASNALELLSRWPDPDPPEGWEAVMTGVARDEAEHLAIVTRLLTRRGGRLSKHHKNPDAAALRALVRKGRGTEELVDRLMISALIEARSCERFELLGRLCPDPRLAKLYRALWASEAGHYRVFLRMARRLLSRRRVEARWSELLDEEARIIAAQPPGPRMHSGAPPVGSPRS